MKKFETTHFPVLGVAGWSKPFTFGFLNRQYITLLSACGVDDESFLQKQV